MLWLIVTLCSLSNAQDEEGLHLKLFANATQYNPRVIPNMWRPLSALDYASLDAFAQDRCQIYNQSMVKYLKQWKMRDVDVFDRLKAQNRIEMGMHDYFVDGELDEFDDERLLRQQPSFDSGKQWSTYLDDYIEEHFNDKFDYPDEYWDDYFHRKRDKDEWFNAYGTVDERRAAFEHHQAQIEIVNRGEMNENLLSEIGSVSLQTTKQRDELIKLITSLNMSELEKLANLTHVTQYTEANGDKSTYYWYVKTTNNEVIIRQFLPPELCEQHLLAHLALEMKRQEVFNYVNLLTDDQVPKFERINRYLGFREEKKGHVFHPIEVDTLVQIQTINEVSLSGEYLDATVAVVMQWTDKRLRWRPDEHGEIRKIRAEKKQMWIPDVEVVNRIHDFAPGDEKPSKLQVEADGRVTYSRYT